MIENAIMRERRQFWERVASSALAAYLVEFKTSIDEVDMQAVELAASYADSMVKAWEKRWMAHLPASLGG